MTYSRRFIGALLTAGVVACMAFPLSAHHGWRWADDGEFTITGTILKAALGNPHGVLTIDVDGVRWTIEVGQPWRNERAGLTDELMSPGTVVTVRGHRSRDAEERRVKAERVIIDGSTFELYPNRD